MPLTAIEIKHYTATVNQTGTNNPVMTILQNQIGNIIWTRNSAGLYYGALTGAFPTTKTQAWAQQSQATDRLVVCEVVDQDTLLLYQGGLDTPFNPVDELANVLLDIKVYHTQPITITPND